MKGFVWFATLGGEFDLLRPALLDRTCRQTNLCTELKFWSFLNEHWFALSAEGWRATW